MVIEERIWELIYFSRENNHGKISVSSLRRRLDSKKDIYPEFRILTKFLGFFFLRVCKCSDTLFSKGCFMTKHLFMQDLQVEVCGKICLISQCLTTSPFGCDQQRNSWNFELLYDLPKKQHLWPSFFSLTLLFFLRISWDTSENHSHSQTKISFLPGNPTRLIN